MKVVDQIRSEEGTSHGWKAYSQLGVAVRRDRRRKNKIRRATTKIWHRQRYSKVTNAWEKYL